MTATEKQQVLLQRRSNGSVMTAAEKRHNKFCYNEEALDGPEKSLS